MERDLLRGLFPRVYSTRPDEPEEGRTFVWSRVGWFERIEGESGDVAFTPFADSEQEVHDLLSSEPDYEWEELDDEFAEQVREEFLTESPLYPEAPELSDEPPEAEEEYESGMHYVDEEENEQSPQ
jgi:hypothetical protein